MGLFRWLFGDHGKPAFEPPPGPKKRVLIIDDNEDFCQLLKENLENINGCYIVGYENKSRNALEAIHDFKPDVILLKLIMPELDGPAIAELIEEDPELGGLPVILLLACPGEPPPAFQRAGDSWVWMIDIQRKLDELLSAIEEVYAAAPGPSWRKREPPTTDGVS